MAMRPNIGRWTLLLAAATLVSAAATAQQTAPGYKELLDVSLVNVDLVVLDSEGNRVQGLTSDRFELFENGVQQKISHFSAYSFQATGPAEPGRAGHRSDRPPFHISLFVDEGIYDRRAQQDIEKTLLDFFGEHLRSTDRVDVFAWNRSLVRLTPQQADRDAVVDSVRNAFKTARQGGLRAPRLDESALRAEEQFDRVLSELSGFERPPEDRLMPDTPTTKRLAAADQTENVRLKTRALSDIALQMGESTGRKALLILSSSFGRYESSRLFTEDPGIEGTPSQAMADDTRGDTIRLATAAQAAGVTVYSLYPGTRETDFPQAMQDIYRETGGVGSTLALRVADTDSLAFLAAATGGLVALSPKGIRDSLPGIGEDLASYYSLAYRSNLEDGQTRDLEVRTTIPGLTVRSRDAVSRAPAAERMAARVRNNIFRRSNSSIRLEVDVSPPSQRRVDPRGAVDIILRFPAIDLLLVPGETKAIGRFTVSIAAGDENFGRLTEVSTERRTFEVPLEYLSEIGNHEIVYRTTVKFAKNATVISVGVRDEESDVSGFVRVGINRSKGRKS